MTPRNDQRAGKCVRLRLSMPPTGLWGYDLLDTTTASQGVSEDRILNDPNLQLLLAQLKGEKV